MRSAPSVVYPVGRCTLYGRVLLLLGCTSLGVWFAWGSATSTLGHWSFWSGVSVWLLWALCSRWAWMRSAEGLLHWDSLADQGADGSRSGAWTWFRNPQSEGAELHAVQTVIDWQSGMLLLLKGPGGVSRWAWVERGRAPVRWDALRRALLASGPR